jgi:hypothetical protein
MRLTLLRAASRGRVAGTRVAPQLFAVAGIVTALGLVTAAGREVRQILSQTTARHAKPAVATAVARPVSM